MRKVSKTLLGIAAIAMSTMPARAAQEAEPQLCVEAYTLAHEFRGEIRGMEAKPGSDTLFRGLAAYVDGFWSIDFETRVRELQKKFPNETKAGTSFDGAGFGAFVRSSQQAKDLLWESTNGAMASLLTPDQVFPGQRKMMEQVRACDLAHKFEPALGEAPTPEKTVALLKAQLEKKIEADKKRLEALNERECAIRFTLAGHMFPASSDGQKAMLERLNVAAAKAMAAESGLTQERLMTLIQRGVEERASKLKDGSYKGETLIEEVNECERKLSLPKTDLKLNGS